MKRQLSITNLFFIFIPLVIGVAGCSKGVSVNSDDLEGRNYGTEKVVVVVIDGPRYEDTWGMEQQPNVPKMAHELLPQGTFFSNFQNNRRTVTVPGHTAIATGNYQGISNDGSELPDKASFLQRYLKETSKPSSKASIVTSKIKLNVLAETNDPEWKGRFTPHTNNGENGKDRADTQTYKEVIKTLQANQPDVMLVQFKGPDSYGHANDWEGYINSIRETDSLVFELWNYLQQDSFYKDKTALLVTNDHGRHSTGHRDGFVSHGDWCKGCKHISLLALGPDFAKGSIIADEYEQIDIAPTVGVLLGIPVPAYDGGKLIMPLLEPEDQRTALFKSSALHEPFAGFPPLSAPQKQDNP